MVEPLTSDRVLAGLTNDGFLRFNAFETTTRAMQNAFRAAEQFFQLPINEKMRNRLPNDTGYRPYGIEYSQAAERPDQVESFTVSHRVPNSASQLRTDEAKALSEEMLVLFDLFEHIAEQIIVGLAFKLSNDTLAEKLCGAFRSWSLLQLNSSHPVGSSSDYINDLHEDGCLLTLMSNTGPGLEVLSSDNTFTPITTASGELLLVPGEILSLLSGGEIRPLYHRVRLAPDDNRRMAMLFFGDIDPRLCQPWKLNHTNMNVDIGDRVLKNSKRYGLTEWSTK
jgi:isopenicillin N synthase-like dioxygenase